MRCALQRSDGRGRAGHKPSPARFWHAAALGAGPLCGWPSSVKKAAGDAAQPPKRWSAQPRCAAHPPPPACRGGRPPCGLLCRWSGAQPVATRAASCLHAGPIQTAPMCAACCTGLTARAPPPLPACLPPRAGRLCAARARAQDGGRLCDLPVPPHPGAQHQRGVRHVQVGAGCWVGGCVGLLERCCCGAALTLVLPRGGVLRCCSACPAPSRASHAHTIPCPAAAAAQPHVPAPERALLQGRDVAAGGGGAAPGRRRPRVWPAVQGDVLPVSGQRLCCSIQVGGVCVEG